MSRIWRVKKWWICVKTTKFIIFNNTHLSTTRLHWKDTIGLDCVQERLNSLPECYAQGVNGLSTDIPLEDGIVDVITAGEFIEHLYPADVDKTLCEFQRVLKIGGRLILTTPNPHYIKNKIGGMSVYGSYLVVANKS